MKNNHRKDHSTVRSWRCFSLSGISWVLILVTLGLQSQAQIIPFAFWNQGPLRFIWMGGPSQNTTTGIYGTQGTGSTSNFPGIRSNAATWTDSSGNFWLFGGNGYDASGNHDLLCDLWKYNSTSGQWTWVSGQNSIDIGGTYGTKGTGSTSNSPGCRQNASSWIDSSGNLWLFGGNGFDSISSWGFLNDLWEYTPSSGKWTWVSGSSTNDQSGHYGTEGTGSTTNHPGGRSDASSWVDGSGNFWIFGGNAYDSASNLGVINDLWEYTPSSSKWTWISGASTIGASGTYGTKGTGSTGNTPGAREDCGFWMDVSGNFWLFGGNSDSTTGTPVWNDVWEFTPSSKKWTWVAGSNTSSANGSYGTEGVGSTSNIPGARSNTTSFKDSAGNFWLFGGYGLDSAGNSGPLNDLWEFNSATLTWTWTSGNNTASTVGVYGTQGAGSTSNYPGSRSNAAMWADSSGNFWIFSGYGLDGVTSVGIRWTHLNDVWKYTVSNGDWTWVSGYSVNLQQGTYSTLGSASTSNLPSARTGAETWMDSAGNLYLFGGLGPDSQDNDEVNDSLNDFWKYSAGTNQWTWLAGSNITYGSSATYGTKGTGSTSNLPGGRNGGANWVDSSGNFWMFGGSGFDSTASFGELNDLWEYAPSTGKWTWMGGSNLANQTANYGTKGSGSTNNIPGPRNGMVQWVDSSGNLWLFGGYGVDSTGSAGYLSDLWEYTPSSGKWTWVSGPNVVNQAGIYGTVGASSTSYVPGGRLQGAAWIDSSGNLWLFAGIGYDSNNTFGILNDLWEYTPSSGKWTWAAGSNVYNASGTYGTQGVGSTSNIPGARWGVVSWADRSGNFWLMGGSGNDGSGTYGYANDIWEYTPSSGQWTWTQGSSLGTPSGVYNTLDVSSASSIPGGRYGPNIWSTPSNGSVWIFGGQGVDASGVLGYMNDFWKLSH